MISSRSMYVEGFFDPLTRAVSYLLLDSESRQCALIDSVLDYDPRTGNIGGANADKLVARVHALGATVQWILETHVHADHLTAAHYLQQKLGGKTGTGQQVMAVQQMFGNLFHESSGFSCEGRQFDHLFADEECFEVGTLTCRALHTPGHTPACMTYVVRDENDIAAFVGDTLFMPELGTARCDFPGASARALYRSINRVLSLPPYTRLYMCHGIQSDGGGAQFSSTVAEEREANIHVRDGVSEEEFVALRARQDAVLDVPDRFLPSVQVNVRAGRFPNWKTRTFNPETSG
ncbi:MBL fold metallo-hydrolase [Noviherbaspirillum sp.]|jgi:glyoxylase-like metal-dependent hydrolase (beta-lactamase superfamily II)|uniref:MBL fold metallo-hydrolase n=1 Tax=Noviherbaspirillum sp. TaxID=1926288 RepID=UPI0025F53339|nr:MBL fold metallo-hydrolase [Noviherbaspirillum sp.]